MTSNKLLHPIFRILHWGVASIVYLNLFILEGGDPPHRYLGYTCVLFALFRVSLSKKKNIPYYNTRASCVYYSIWLLIGALAITGWMMGLDQFWGNRILESVHLTCSNILIGLVIIHLSGVFLDAFKHKRKTWMVMISGRYYLK